MSSAVTPELPDEPMVKELLVPSGTRDRGAPEPARAARPDGDRAALLVFCAVLAAAFVGYALIGRGIWFWADEWDPLAVRKLNVHDLLASHGGHLIALPVVAYRVLFAVFGVRTYLPYQLMSIVAWLTVGALLRVVIRRAGVGAWMATLVASVFVLLGSASYDIIFAFQVTFVGAVAFGLVQLLLADHDGPIDRRDWFGVAAGLAAILCSGVGVTMVAVVGLAALARRGWRAAVLHAVPLAVVYVSWWFTHRENQLVTHDAGRLLRWDWRGVGALFDALGHVPFVGWLLAAMLVAGLVLAVRDRNGVRILRTSAVAPLALLAGALVFLTMSGSARALFALQEARASRYVGVTAALTLPALALAADALVRRSRVLTVLVPVVLLLGIPGNLAETRSNLLPTRVFDRGRQTLGSLARADLARRVPPWVEPDPSGEPRVTVGWLLETADAGKLPATRPPTPTERATSTLMLSLAQTSGKNGAHCDRLTGPTGFELQPGDSLTVLGAIKVRLVDDAGVMSDWVDFGAGFWTGPFAHLLRDVAGPLTLDLRPKGAAAYVCGPVRA